jgi:hypothetical protein
MVRIWHVPPAYLDNQRLLGEHLELHIILSAISKLQQKRKGGYTRHPETIKYSNRVSFLLRRHDSLVREMRLRGWKSGEKHLTPPKTAGIPPSALRHYRVTKELIRKDIADLKQRWKREGKKGGRLPINQLEKSLRE